MLSSPRVSSKSMFRGGLFLVSFALLLAVAFPLWKPLLLGAVLAATLLPWHDRLSVLLRGRRALAAVLLLVGLVVPVLLVLAWIVVVAVRQAAETVDSVREVLQTSGLEGLLEHLPGWMSGPIRDAL